MYQRIIVPVDASETSNKALVAALQLARDAGGRVRLLHVVEDMAYLIGYDGSYAAELRQAMRQAGAKVLDDALAIAQSAGVEADSVLFDQPAGRLAEVVAETARHWKADLVVVGTHGRRGVGRLLLGSGAEQILRLAPVPVLLVRLGEDDGATAA
jgi:nucleotide-binding universal stress UspA family protein